MIVCDFCKDAKRATFPVEMVIQKSEQRAGKKKAVVTPKKRQIITIRFDLCDEHLTLFCKRLGTLKASGLLTNDSPAFMDLIKQWNVLEAKTEGEDHVQG